jgi:hypothetical protein
MTAHTTQLTLTSVDDEVPATARFTLDKGLAVRELADHLTALSSGRRLGTVAVLTDNGTSARATGTVVLSGVGGTAATGSYALSGVGGTAATGSYTLSGVGGTAASNTVTLGGAAGDVTIVTDGTSVGPVVFNTDDTQTALDAITALNANGTFAAKATATDGGAGVITITWDTKGTVGNSKTLTASRTAGTATVGGNGTTLGGGAQGSVGTTINGTLVTTDTTNLSDTDAATAVAAAIEANGTIGSQIAAVGNAAIVELTWSTKGTVGNAVTLAAGTSATGTATRSGATMTGGAQGAVTVVINGTSVGPVDVTNLSDTAAATTVAAAIEANGTLGPLLVAVGSTTNVNLTWGAKGTAGNAVTLAAGTSATGTATRSGATLSGGAQGSVTVTIGGTGVVTDTTNLTDAAAGTAIVAAITANSTVNKWVTASGTTTVTLTAILYGLIGNSISLTSTSATGTATAGAARLAGGTADTSAVTVTF